ncbi:STAS domain-containing protein [Streptomyces sp. NPDC008150]|uniref:STAS domain-containing protein n=1 Tax=Streptomyces sp. NPDC008150 TaxID=3364816 RepID=UPI0036E11429
MSTKDSADPELPVIAPRGDLDAETVPPLADELESAGTLHPGLVLDAEGIEFADSSFLNVLLTFHRRTDLRVAAPSPAVARLLAITGTDTVLSVYPSVQAAQVPRPRTPGEDHTG